MELKDSPHPISMIWAGIPSMQKSCEYPAVLIHPCRQHYTDPNPQIKVGDQVLNFTAARDRILAEMEIDANDHRKWDYLKACGPPNR